MGKETKKLEIAALDMIKELGKAYFDAAAVNPIMATSAGLLPYILLSIIVPVPGQAGIIAVGAVAGLSNVPNIAVSTPIWSFGINAAQARFPAQINLVRTDKIMGIHEEKADNEQQMLLRVLGAKALIK